MLKTRDKALISLTALFQAALGIFGFLHMLVRKEIFCNENDLPAAVSMLVLLFVVTFAFAVVMRDLPSKTYVIPAFSMPMIFLIAGFLGVGADFDAAGVAHMTAGGTASVIIFAVGTAGIVIYPVPSSRRLPLRNLQCLRRQQSRRGCCIPLRHLPCGRKCSP